MAALFAQARGALTARLEGAVWRIGHERSPGFETDATGWHCLPMRQMRNDCDPMR